MTAAPLRPLRLGPLPKQEAVRLTIMFPVPVKAMLDRYAAQHAKLHGAPVDAAALVPHMVEAFMQRDRGFAKGEDARPPGRQAT